MPSKIVSEELQALRRRVVELESKLAQKANVGITQGPVPEVGKIGSHWTLPHSERDEQPVSGGPLAGITVLDLTQVLAGPYCGKMLVDLGARVIKIEPPDPPNGSEGLVRAMTSPYYFASVNYGKESISLDLKNADDLGVFDKLLAKADVMIQNFRTGVIDRLGYGWESVHARFPRLIMCSISGFGSDGPYGKRPSMDPIAQAMSGLNSITGWEGTPPVGMGANVADVYSGTIACCGIQAALLDRYKNNGTGRHVDISMLDSNFAIHSHIITKFAKSSVRPLRNGTWWYGGAPLDSYATKLKDEYLVLIAYQAKDFKLLCELLGKPEWLQHPLYGTNSKRVANYAPFKHALEAVLAQRTRKEWLDVFLPAGVACGPVNTIDEAVEDPSLRQRKMLASVHDNGNDCEWTVAGNPIKISGFTDSNKRAFVAGFNEHGDDIRSRL
jgi:CoA:oxalate CoA-transferase